MMKNWRDVLPIHPAAEMVEAVTKEGQRVLRGDLKQHGQREPVVLVRIGHGCEQLLDGRTRLDLQEANGDDVTDADGKLTVPHRTVELPDDAAAISYVLSLNLFRRHLTLKQKRELIEKLLKAEPSKSDRHIAATVKASPTTVGSVRAEMEATGDVSKLDTRTDSKGRKQPARKTTTKPPPVSAEVLQQREAAAERIRARMGGNKVRDDIGSESAGECERLRARNEELQAQLTHFEFQNIALRSEDGELKAVRKPEGEDEDSELGNLLRAWGYLLRAWDSASEGAREKFKAHVGFVAVEPPAKAMDDGLDIPEFLRRAAP
jgi:hypothetical protein